MTEDGPVLDPSEFDIEDDERVREIGTDRYVVSASGDPPAPSDSDPDHGAGGGRSDAPAGRGDNSAGRADADGAAPPRGLDDAVSDGTRGDSPAASAGTGSSGGHARDGRTRDTGRRPDDGRVRENDPRSGSDTVPGGRDPPTSEPSRQRGTRAAGGQADRGATGGGWDRHAERTNGRGHGTHDAAGVGPDTAPDAAAVSRWLADSLRDNGFAYGFDATVSMDGEVSRHRTVSDDVTEAFETLAVWFARNASDGDPERALGVLCSQMDTSVELPPDLIRQAAVEHDLSADDSIGDLLRAVRDEGHVTLE